MNVKIDEATPVRILVQEVSMYGRPKTLEKIEINQTIEGNLEKEFNVRTSNSIQKIEIVITQEENTNNLITINEILVNNKKHVTKYKYMPMELVRLVRTLNTKTKSISDRLVFYKDGLNAAKDHLIIGNGGNAFANHVAGYKTYNYGYDIQTHSSTLDILLDNGILGIVSYVGIIFVTIQSAFKVIKKYRKDAKKQEEYLIYITMLTGLGVMILHSVFDFDLTYLVTLSMYYMFMGMLNFEKNVTEGGKAYKINMQICDTVVTIIFAIALVICLGRVISETLKADQKYYQALNFAPFSSKTKEYIIEIQHENKDYIGLEKSINNYIDTEKTKYQYNMYYKMVDIARYYIKNKENEKANVVFDKILTTIELYDNTKRFNIYEIQKRLKFLLDTAQYLDELEEIQEFQQIKQKFIQIALNNCYSDLEQINNSDLNKYTLSNIQNANTAYLENIQKIAIIKNK